MMAKSHVPFAVICYGTFQYLTTSEIHLNETYLLAMFGGLFPDIDHPKSWMGRRMGLLSYPLSKLLGHRGITHSFIALGLLYAAYANISAPPYSAWFTAFSIGYASHLLGDFLTHAGIPLFYPQRKRFRFFFTFKTGGTGESALLISLALLSLYLIITLPVSIKVF